MKKRLLIIGLIALMLVLVACKKIELNPSAQPDKDTGIIKLPEVPVKEEPKPVELPKEEPKVEEPKPVEISNEHRVKKGDSFTFKNHTIKATEILRSTDVTLRVDDENIYFTKTQQSEIIGGMLLTYVTSNFSADSTITLRADDFALKPDEHIVKYRDTIVAYGDTVKIDNIVYDEGFRINAIWVSISSDPSSSEKILEGEEKVMGQLRIKAVKVNPDIRQYALVSITQK